MAEEEKQDDKSKEKEKKDNKVLDIGVPIGWVLGMAIVVGAIIQAGGVAGAAGFLDIASILIVLGGFSVALIVTFGFKDFFGGFKIILSSLKKEKVDVEEIIKQFIEMAQKARQQGLLALEADLEEIKDPYLQKGLKLAIDGYEENEIRGIMEKELDLIQIRHSKGQDIMEKAGDYAPAWGMIGTLIGLVLMLNNLDDPSTLGPSMAVAMLTTMYGAVVANLFAIPLLGKLQRNTAEEVFIKELIIDGVLEIQKGQIPSKLKAKLETYIDPNASKKKNKKKKGEGEEGEEGEGENNNG